MTEHFTEEIRLRGDELIQKIKQLIHEGNVRSITIKDKDGNVIFSMPLTVGIIGAVYAPMLAAVGAVAALVTECTITVVRKEAPAMNAEAAADVEPTVE